MPEQTGGAVEDVGRLITLMRSWARELSRPPESIRDAIDIALLAHERGHLVIAGGEGAGKSTLINALLGGEVSPTSDGWPGTVAPVYFSHGPQRTPRYLLVLHASDGTVAERETDRAGFDRHLLQEHNPDNTLGVLRGEVTLDHPLLRSGLRLVDLPGAQGVSAQVAEATRQLLTGTACTLVLVSLGRVSLSVLADVLRDIQASHHDIHLAAVVINEINASAVGPDRLAANLEMRRRAVRQLLPQSTDDTDVFVLHLLSLAGSGTDPTDTAGAGSDQREQWDEFVRRVTTRARDNGHTVAVAASRRALRLLDAALAERAAILDDLRFGRMSRAQREALAQRALTTAMAGAPGAATRAEESTRAAAWADVEAVVRRHSESIRALLDRHESQVAAQATLPLQQAKAIEKEIEEALAAATADINAAVARSGDDLIAALLTVHHDAVETFGSVLPTVEPVGDPNLQVTAGKPEIGAYTSLSSVARAILARLIEKGGSQRWRSASAQVLTASVIPLAAVLWPIGIVAPFTYYAMGGNRSDTLRAVRELRAQIITNLATGESGKLRASWLANRRSMAHAVAKQIREDLVALGGRTVEGTDGVIVGLAAQYEAVVRARAEIAARMPRLEHPSGGAPNSQ
ncbi:dynamin family protein [Catellatospora sp. KI3]|uniref:dynamin family protein n=1 Tax=Catellatospora sp. KI3 TaxID=3041620 RepID=UPI002482CC52|nr:dynamin family protein [Catellatospora sp. KI3]MDI1461051.1 dynamin family protein [Catellatospora sp. KI3]